MADIFDTKIMCSKCNLVMSKGETFRNGFRIRRVECQKCGEKVNHPGDMSEYNQFVELKNKEFKVKLRLVGNSYAVSIPREIINFMREQEEVMNDMVHMCFDSAKRLNITFGEED